MSSLFIVKCQGKNISELKKALQAALVELGGVKSLTGSRSVAIEEPTDVESVSNDDEMEEVPSPYVNSPSSSFGTNPSQEPYYHVNTENLVNLPSKPSTPEASVKETVNYTHGDLDAEGLPWDERIHASSKAKVANGTWRTKRGADDIFVLQIKSELRNRAPQAAVATPPAPQQTYQAPAQPYVAPAPVAAPAPAMPSQQMQSGHTVDTFKQNFPMVVGTLISQGKLTQEYIQEICNWAQVPQIWMINDEQKAIMFEQFAQNGLIQKVG